jgi:hypothetical protein
MIMTTLGMATGTTLFASSAPTITQNVMDYLCGNHFIPQDAPVSEGSAFVQGPEFAKAISNRGERPLQAIFRFHREEIMHNLGQDELPSPLLEVITEGCFNRKITSREIIANYCDAIAKTMIKGAETAVGHILLIGTVAITSNGWSDWDIDKAGLPNPFKELSKEQVNGLKVGDRVWRYEMDLLYQQGKVYGFVMLEVTHVEHGKGKPQIQLKGHDVNMTSDGDNLFGANERTVAEILQEHKDARSVGLEDPLLL